MNNSHPSPPSPPLPPFLPLMSPSSATCCRQSARKQCGACALRRYRRVRAYCVLDVEKPSDADGALGWSQTCTKLCSKCHVLLGMLALTDCDTTSFPLNKGKVSALSVLEAGLFPGLFHILGRKTTCDGTLWMLDCPFFVHCTARHQTHRWKRRCITCTDK